MASSISAGTTSSTALVSTADTSGALVLQTNNGTTALTLDTSQNATFAGYANLPNTFGFKNRIINGAMVIDQRNAGASVSATSGVYTLDRWNVQNNSGAARFNVQQNVNSVTPPAGYKYYLGITSTAAYSVAATDVIGIQQFIEGYNIADLGWGASGAATITFSFWVRSSLTGTFGGNIIEGAAGTAFYPFTYTISAANTWEQKTVTITGPTIGTWNSTNGRGPQVLFCLGIGSSYTGTANAWTSSAVYGPTGGTNFVATNAATWYVTGVQLEKGSTATSFDYRSYGTELALCQRYAWKYGGLASDIFGAGPGLYADGNEIIFGPVMCPVLMRATPSMTVFGTPIVKNNGSGSTGWTPTIASATTQMPFIRMSKASHGVTPGVTTNLNFDSTSDYLIFSAEL